MSSDDVTTLIADLNNYGQAMNSCESVDEVASLTIEASSVPLAAEYATVAVDDGDRLRVVATTDPGLDAGAEPRQAAQAAYERGSPVRETIESSDGAPILSVPMSVAGDRIGVVTVRPDDAVSLAEEHTHPLEILASHAATAIANIRSRERLDRARRDAEARKEMVEMYDRLLRHDLRNELQVILGAVSTLDPATDDQRARQIRRIEEAAETSADLVERVGDIVRTLERDDDPEPRHLGSTLANTVETVEQQYDSLSVSFDRDAFDYRVLAGELLESVFTNVLSNAAQHTDSEVSVIVDAEKPTEDTVTVHFADDGHGVPADVSVFEIGTKGTDSSGSGLGLGLVRALARAYGGEVTVDDSERGGADFQVRLRRA